MRRMSLTPEFVSLCHREEVDPGPDGSWTQLTDEDFRTLALRLSDEADAGPLWVFAYGSLIWKPAFESVERQRATAFGWHRSFCLDMVRWRGSVAQPGLMMALERGGRCDGVIYRLPDGDKPEQIERLLRREIDDHESVSSVRWVPVRTEQGPIRALGFWVGVTGRGTSLGQPLDTVARVLARACGHVGSGAEYLYNTVSHLEEFGMTAICGGCSNWSPTKSGRSMAVPPRRAPRRHSDQCRPSRKAWCSARVISRRLWLHEQSPQLCIRD